MTTFTLLGTNSDYFGDAFLSNSDEIEVDIVSTSATTVVVNNPFTGITTTISGTGLTFSGAPGDEEPSGGTVTSLSMSSAGNSVLEGTVTGLNLSFVALSQALDALAADNLVPIANLLNSGGPITFDASNAATGLNMFELLDPDFSDLITQPVTVLGSEFYDQIFGGLGNDSIVTGGDNGNDNGGDIEGTVGNDTIDFSNSTSTSFQWLDYEDFVDGAVTFNVNAAANTGTITGTGFSDTLVNVRAIMEAFGLALEGGEANDVFNVTNSSSENSWFNLRGNEGNDTYNINIANGGGRISFNFGSSDAPTSGINVNLNTGFVSNDGFGGQDTINVLSGDGRLEIRASDNNDSILGSDRDESFITEQGNDTVNGGGGFDRVRYDRSGVDVVNVNLATQTATGIWDGNAFTDTLISIEYVRGSRLGNDTLIGSTAEERLEGRGGNDSLFGAAGDDRLDGGDGNDTLRGGGGRDDLIGGDGNDLIDASGGFASTQGFGDFIRAGLGQDTILGHAEHWATGEGADISYSDVGRVGGVTITSGQDGTGTVVSGDGRVNDTFTFIHYFQGSQDSDRITGAAESRWEGFEGNAGNDTIDGGGGDAQVGYNNEHFEGGSSGVTVNMGTGNQGTAVGTATDTFGDTDTLIRIDMVQGSIFDDTLSAVNRTDNVRLEGNDGNDVLSGGSGFDQIFGGDQGDTISAGAGGDTVDGGNGR
ncbi:calcium-binding protein, partial [uncultured Tateyamaria sp.]|uniref:beta strand repeat-containing protein n=1 Tax=uncultured Tateyamaria sp. TaxID=455651 RepID=UPI002609700B